MCRHNRRCNSPSTSTAAARDRKRRSRANTNRDHTEQSTTPGAAGDVTPGHTTDNNAAVTDATTGHESGIYRRSWTTKAEDVTATPHQMRDQDQQDPSRSVHNRADGVPPLMQADVTGPVTFDTTNRHITFGTPAGDVTPPATSRDTRRTTARSTSAAAMSDADRAALAKRGIQIGTVHGSIHSD